MLTSYSLPVPISYDLSPCTNITTGNSDADNVVFLSAETSASTNKQQHEFQQCLPYDTIGYIRIVRSKADTVGPTMNWKKWWQETKNRTEKSQKYRKQSENHGVSPEEWEKSRTKPKVGLHNVSEEDVTEPRPQ